MEVISREVIKPSSPEIDHPKKFKLSYLDEITAPRFYVPIIFFYEADESKRLTSPNHVQISKQLKQSLSAALTPFYPLAGRVEGEGDDVDCNDAGVEFIEARVHAQLVDVLKGQYREDYKLEQYYYLPVIDSAIKPFLFVQITSFDCGGIALGISFSHLLADCHSIMMFINAWASACRSVENINIPQMVSFDLANYFPARKIPPMDFATPNSKLMRTKLFVFDKEKIALLKKKAATVTNPTRVEVISAFIWKFKLDFKCTTKSTTTFAAMQAVNLRGRKTTLLENVFGNCIMLSLAYADVGEFDALVAKLRRLFKKFDDDYITESQNGDTYLNDFYSRNGEGEMEVCSFLSWSRFPFYQVDYGFGTPILFCPAMEMNNGCVFVSSKTGESIEAWVAMEEHNLQMLENQINLISTTTV